MSEHNVTLVHRFFELLNQKDVESWAELWHEQARIIVPYPPVNFPGLIEGKAAILEGFRTLFANYQSFTSEVKAVYPAADSDAVCAEWRVHAVLLSAIEYTNENITVFRIEDGLITEYHDYFDPRRFQVVVDALG